MDIIGMFSGSFAFCGVIIALLGAVAYFGLPIYAWSFVIAIGLLGMGVATPVWIAFGVYFILFNVKPIRAILISSVTLKVIKALGILPKISATERTALEAGKVWVETEIFKGKPNFKRMMTELWPKLTTEEQSFLDNQVQKVCEMTDDHRAWEEGDLSQEVWEYLKKEGFFGMIIPKSYGGLEFSALGHSAVIKKLGSRSVPLCVTAMVPNSLGPAELLLHYGTEKQKNHYLPRLAKGIEIPCFALTEPNAGSDAGSLTSHGTLFKGSDGKIYVRLNWNKRYITLAAVSTVMGLAFRLNDPENLLGKNKVDLGITCALIPSNSPGVKLGRRHNPLNTPFFNCPTDGENVELLAEEVIIGGLEGAGNGWQMLMESLAAGRGISLPAQNTGGSCAAAVYAGGYSAIRKQFGLNIGKFEGVQEPLSTIAGFSYLLESSRLYTLGAIDSGIQPPIVTAIMKYQSTEIGRKIIISAMDIVGGAGISKGPRNVIGNFWTATPIGITVEGANILTRTLIIFGQGLMRAHPFVFQEIDALEKGDVSRFDKAFWGHIGLVAQNLVRASWLSITRGRFVIPYKMGSTARYYQKLTWACATFSLMSDIAMGTMGGKLKTSEMLTGRFADALSWIYLGISVLRRFEADGRPANQKPFVHWCMQTSLYKIQTAFTGIFTNFYIPIPIVGPILGWIIRHPIKIWAKINTLDEENNDKNNQKLALIIQKPGKLRDMFKDGVYIPAKDQKHDGLRIIEDAFEAHWESLGVQKKIKSAIRKRQLPKKRILSVLDEALEKSIISKEEFDLIKNAEKLRDHAIQVDDFKIEGITNAHKADGGSPKPTAINS